MKVAFIPVRGGSKSIPLKNIKLFCGKPLVYWTVNAACTCREIDRVYVATDSEEIRQTLERIKENGEIANPQKINVVGRSVQSASDGASTESAMLEFAAQYDFDDIVLIQATSPLLTGEDLDKGFGLYEKAETDSVISVVRQKRFYWNTDASGLAFPINYDVYHRPRRQDFAGTLVENGAFYITSRELLLDSRNRVSGRIKALEMDEDSYFEIDEPGDWLIAENLMRRRNAALQHIVEGESEKPLGRIRMLLTDCDGCLTDAGMYYSESGDELKKFCARDGMGFTLIRQQGIVTGIITGEDRELNKRRAEKLKVNEFVGNCKDKAATVRGLCEKYGIPREQVCYIGDDVNDLGAFSVAGVTFCPADAIPRVRNVADYVTKARGGEGVIREVVDRILEEKCK